MNALKLGVLQLSDESSVNSNVNANIIFKFQQISRVFQRSCKTEIVPTRDTFR
jgi:hypothetical protein